MFTDFIKAEAEAMYLGFHTGKEAANILIGNCAKKNGGRLNRAEMLAICDECYEIYEALGWEVNKLLQ